MKNCIISSNFGPKLIIFKICIFYSGWLGTTFPFNYRDATNPLPHCRRPYWSITSLNAYFSKIAEGEVYDKHEKLP
jgi:hypothetical protein